VPYSLLNSRLSLGWDIERALITPSREPKLYTFNSESLSLKEWAEKLNVPKYLLKSRLYKGWSLENALITPTQIHKNNIKKVENGV
jgi:hypothetical protein